MNSEDAENAKILETVQDMRHKLGLDVSPDCTFESSRHESFYGTSNSTFDAGSHTSAFGENRFVLKLDTVIRFSIK